MSDVIYGPTDEYVELEALCVANGGRVTPALVLDRAADPSSTFHQHITWDDTEAARKFRLQQAGAIIRKFKIIETSGGQTIKVDAYVKIPDSLDGYAPVREAITMDSFVQQRHLLMRRKIERLVEELRHWDEFAALADVMTAALAEAS
jgi:hypothetical protein